MSGIATLFFGLCLHISGQFEIVSSRMMKTFQIMDLLDGEKLSKDENDQLNIKLRNFVNFHNEIIALGELLSRTFSPIVFVQFTASSILICLACLMLFLAPPTEKLIYMNFAMGITFDTFLHCYVADRLIWASTGLREAAYNLSWYRCDERNQKLILMIIMRTQKPTGMKIPFFKASLETFLTVTDFLVL